MREPFFEKLRLKFLFICGRRGSRKVWAKKRKKISIKSINTIDKTLCFVDEISLTVDVIYEVFSYKSDFLIAEF